MPTFRIVTATAQRLALILLISLAILLGSALLLLPSVLDDLSLFTPLFTSGMGAVMAAAAYDGTTNKLQRSTAIHSVQEGGRFRKQTCCLCSLHSPHPIALFLSSFHYSTVPSSDWPTGLRTAANK
ncbi:hypothetical protein B0T25DRAFT_515258 [Lasiosphaeria hispida]|uniref:Uncharacterized protein n=1 Tax=Lasiosphaeria hispida TaxID=260671 RepID=A0AAJ0MI03_9PEZI|nr:hypothetical protein B0T25DRAFT_515258 [Lasiosphaeria hispida]